MKAGNAIIDAYKGPVAPEKYIDGSSLSEAEITAIANKATATYKSCLLYTSIYRAVSIPF